MALPAIALSLAFPGGIFMAALAISPILAGALGAVAAALHWWRFHVPITVATGTLALLFSVVLIVQMVPIIGAYPLTIVLLAGIVVFAIALRWDFSDTHRRTRRADVAFWLHLLAAPMMVHPLFLALDILDGRTGMLRIACVLGLYALLAVISLAIDRRALMVSALGYVLFAFSALLKHYGVVSLNFALAAAAISGTLLLLSAYWRPCRTWVVAMLPAAWRAKLVPQH